MVGGIPGGAAVQKLPAHAGDTVDPWVGEIPRRRKWQPTPVFLEFWRILWTEEPGGATVHGAAKSQTWLSRGARGGGKHKAGSCGLEVFTT